MLLMTYGTDNIRAVTGTNLLAITGYWKRPGSYSSIRARTGTAVSGAAP
jgi:hypothetical protein